MLSVAYCHCKDISAAISSRMEFSEFNYTTERSDMTTSVYNSTSRDNVSTSSLTPRTFQSGPTGLMTVEQSALVRFISLQVILPIICVVGLLGNLLSVGAMFNVKDNKAFTCYLKALTLSDSFTLLCGLARFVCDVINTYVPEIGSELKAYGELYIGLMGTFSWNLSSYLITVMSIERFVAVVFPFYMRRFVFDRYPKVIISAIFALQIVFRTPSWIWLEVVEKHSIQTNATIYFVHYKTWAQTLPLRNYISLVLVIFDMFVPIVIVMLANTVILVMLKRRSQVRIGEDNPNHHKMLGSDQRKITITLVTLSAFYLLSIAPNTTIYVMNQAMPDFAAMRLREINLMNAVSNISVLIICLNSANDFIIYILSSRRLRELIFTRYFSKCYQNLNPDKGRQLTRNKTTWTSQAV